MTGHNLHTHTAYVDGVNTPEEMIQAAIQKGLHTLGFSEHAYLTGGNCCMTLAQTEAYKREIAALKQKYKDRITIFLGLENDLQEPQPLDGYDYSIGSLHAIVSDAGTYCCVDESKETFIDNANRYFGGDTLAVVARYYQTLANYIVEQPMDIIGHFDLLTKFNADNDMFDENSPAYQELALNALHKANKTGYIFEVNTGGMARGLTRRPYLAPFMLEKLKAWGSKITISSDSHAAKTIDAYFPQAVQLVKQHGFTHEYQLTKDGFVQVPL